MNRKGFSGLVSGGRHAPYRQIRPQTLDAGGLFGGALRLIAGCEAEAASFPSLRMWDGSFLPAANWNIQ
jgi:hypothetical protein